MARKGKDIAERLATRLARAAALSLLSLAALLSAGSRLYAADYEWGSDFAVYEERARGWGTPASRTDLAFKFTAQYSGTIDEIQMLVGRGSLNTMQGKIGIADTLAGGGVVQTYLGVATLTLNQAISGYPYWQTASTGTPVTAGQPYYVICEGTTLSCSGKAGVVIGYPGPVNDVGTPIYPDGTPDADLQIWFRKCAGLAYGQVSGAVPTFVVRYDAGANYQGQPYGSYVTSNNEGLSYLEGGIDTSISPNTLQHISDRGQVYGTRATGYFFTADANTKNIVKAKVYMRKLGNPANPIYVRVVKAASPYTVILDSTTYLAPGSVATSFGWQPANGVAFPAGIFTQGESYYVYFFTSAGDVSNRYDISVMDTNDRAGNPPNGAAQMAYGGNADYYVYTTNYNNVTTFVRGYTNTYGDIPLKLTCDTDRPEVAITKPVHTATYKDLVRLEGTAYDNYYLRDGGVELCIRNITAGKVWTGGAWTDWSGSPVWVTTGPASVAAGDTNNWVYYMSWLHNNRYDIYNRAKDSANLYTAGWSTTTFYFDQFQPAPAEVPDSTMTFPSNGIFVSALDTISGTALDNSPNGKISLVKWMLWQAGSYWNGGGWPAGAPPPDVDADWINSDDGAGSYQVNWNEYFINGQMPSPAQMTTGATYYIASRAQDSATNAGTAEPNKELVRSTFTFYWDAVPPVADITVPGDGGVAGPGPTF